jgi:UDP-2,3-diacylglucosamine hydrolase
LTTIFVSDLHFGLFDREEEYEREKKFVNFLYSINNPNNKLYILGDLFDYWFEYKRVIQKGFFRTFTALKDLTENGVEIHFFIGNHDFMHRDFFEKDLNLIVHEDPISVEIDGKKFFLGHGDGLVKNDLGYNILKKIIRNKSLQKLYSLLHPDFGIWLASSSSKKSRDYTTEKSYGEVDGLLETAFEKIDSGYDYVIFGHSHLKRNENYKNGRYINLGTWLTEPCYAKFENGILDLIEWKNND